MRSARTSSLVGRWRPSKRRRLQQCSHDLVFRVGVGRVVKWREVSRGQLEQGRGSVVLKNLTKSSVLVVVVVAAVFADLLWLLINSSSSSSGSVVVVLVMRTDKNVGYCNCSAGCRSVLVIPFRLHLKLLIWTRSCDACSVKQCLSWQRSVAKVPRKSVKAPAGW